MKPRQTRTSSGVKEPELGLAGKSYLPLIVAGITTTLKHLVSPKMTVQTPEERHEMADPLGYRGVHRLNRDEQGRVKCVACFPVCNGPALHIVSISSLPRAPGRTVRNTPQSFLNRRASMYLLRDV